MADREIRKLLKRLQQEVRQKQSKVPGPDVSFMSFGVRAKDGDPVSNISLVESQRAAYEAALTELLDDLSYEHLGDGLEKALYRFVYDCATKRREDHVPNFIKQHGRNLEQAQCYGLIERFRTNKPQSVGKLRILPLGDPEAPALDWYDVGNDFHCWAMVQVEGTNPKNMINRGRVTLEGELQSFRVVLALSTEFAKQQLRFQLTPLVVLKGHITSVRAPDIMGINTEIPASAWPDLDSALISSIMSPSNEIEERVRISSRWLERSMLTGDPLVSLLFGFFALESLLGDKSQGLKAPLLAYRLAMLDLVSRGHFSHPDRVWFLYSDVRSVAVHGGHVEITWQDGEHFIGSVWNALRQVVELSHQQGLVRSKKLFNLLDQHPVRIEFLDWLKHNSTGNWAAFFKSEQVVATKRDHSEKEIGGA